MSDNGVRAGDNESMISEEGQFKRKVFSEGVIRVETKDGAAEGQRITQQEAVGERANNEGSFLAKE